MSCLIGRRPGRPGARAIRTLPADRSHKEGQHPMRLNTRVALLVAGAAIGRRRIRRFLALVVVVVVVFILVRVSGFTL